MFSKDGRKFFFVRAIPQGGRGKFYHITVSSSQVRPPAFCAAVLLGSCPQGEHTRPSQDLKEPREVDVHGWIPRVREAWRLSNCRGSEQGSDWSLNFLLILKNMNMEYDTTSNSRRIQELTSG